MYEEDNDFPVFYCSRCWSSNILRGKKIPNTDCHDLYCGDCGAGPKHIDVTLHSKWVKLFKEKTGRDPYHPEPSVYDDLEAIYNEEAIDIMTADEALSNGMNVGDFINRKIKE